VPNVHSGGQAAFGEAIFQCRAPRLASLVGHQILFGGSFALPGEFE
jgi:hypothetical protein